MELRYQLDPTDLEALTAFVNRGTVLGWVLARMHWVGGAVMVVFAAYVFDPRSPVMTGAAVLTFAVSLVVFWSLVAELDRYAQRLPPAPAAAGRLMRMAILGVALLAVIVLAWHFALLQKPR